MRLLALAQSIALAAGIALLAACSGGGEGRAVPITVRDDGCAPERIAASPGERLVFVVKNESRTDRELEGIDGTRLEEVLIPAGRTRNIAFTVPASGGTQHLKCYLPGGPTTLIAVEAGGVGGGAAADPDPTAGSGSPAASGTLAPAATVRVSLMSYAVRADAGAVAAGPTRFVAHNDSPKDRHELAVLRVRADGSLQNLGEVEPMAPGDSGEVVIALTPGKYQLACLIAVGEAGSTVDHYQAGMHVALEVR